MQRSAWTALAALAAALATAGCPPRRAANVARPAQPSLEQEVAHLSIPPGSETGAALTRLDARAEASEVAAGWARLHYLIDLFDDARFRRAGDSLALLTQAMGREDGARGPQLTDAALAFLLVEADRILAVDRLHAGALAARTLIEADAEPPASRAEVFQRMVELKTVANGGGALAANARLRLFGFCRQAFGDALQAPRQARLRMITFCLYPLYDSDPEPYFDDDPRRRPPAPNWPDLGERMLGLAADVARAGGRLGAAASAAEAEWRALLEQQASELPSPPNPAALGVPTVDRAAPFDDTPLLAIGDGRAIASRDALLDQLRAALQTDPRGAIAVALYAQAAADSLYRVASAASAAGATRLELAVGFTQQLQVPTGDYWFGRTRDGSVARVGVLPLSLAPMSDLEDGVSQRPRAVDWDPRRAALALHLVVQRDTWTLVAPTGQLARVSTGAGDPRSALRDVLADVRSAYPDEDGLIVVIGADATYAALISALTAAAFDAAGERFFAQLALATAAPAPTKHALERRIARRKSATVAVTPDELAARAPVARRCYQPLLEAAPRTAGVVRVELRDGEPTVTSGPPDRKLRACALAAVAAPMKERAMASATVSFAAR